MLEIRNKLELKNLLSLSYLKRITEENDRLLVTLKSEAKKIYQSSKYTFFHSLKTLANFASKCR
jgi:hypothetical protein